MKSAMSCLATQTKATFRTPNAHHGTSGKWKPRPFPCCVVSLWACRERNTAVVTSDHGAKARHSPSGQPNASSARLTKSFAQGTPESESPKKRRLANRTLASRRSPLYDGKLSSIYFYTAVGSHICRPAKNSWQATCLRPLQPRRAETPNHRAGAA